MTANDRREWAYLDFVAEGNRRFGDDPTAWQFVCPNCGDVSSMADFVGAGVDPDRVGQECIGRSITGRGCDWAAYGLIGGPWLVTMPADGERPESTVRSFAFAPAVVCGVYGCWTRTTPGGAMLDTKWWGPCDRPATDLVRAWCERGHERDRRVCAAHMDMLTRPRADEVTLCVVCHEADGTESRLTPLVDTPDRPRAEQHWRIDESPAPAAGVPCRDECRDGCEP